MKKLLNVNFNWLESPSEFGESSHILSVKIGSLFVTIGSSLRPDKRGFYDGNEIPVVFTKDLNKAKERVEKRIIKQLKE